MWYSFGQLLDSGWGGRYLFRSISAHWVGYENTFLKVVLLTSGWGVSVHHVLSITKSGGPAHGRTFHACHFITDKLTNNT